MSEGGQGQAVITVAGQCEHCGGAFEAERYSPRGRKPRYCSEACKSKRKRAVARKREIDSIIEARRRAGISAIGVCFACEKTLSPAEKIRAGDNRVPLCDRCHKMHEGG